MPWNLHPWIPSSFHHPITLDLLNRFMVFVFKQSFSHLNPEGLLKGTGECDATLSDSPKYHYVLLPILKKSD